VVTPAFEELAPDLEAAHDYVRRRTLDLVVDRLELERPGERGSR